MEQQIMDLALIQTRIYEVGGQKVMLDFDLAALYNVETRVLNQAVKRNSKKFPIDFMFRLTKADLPNLKSQIVTSSWGGTRKLPFAFTEHGVTMLASVLRSESAIKMNIAIVRAFIFLRQLPLHHKEFFLKLEELKDEMHTQFGQYDSQLDAIYDAIENLLDGKVLQNTWDQRERIGFKK